MRNLLQRTLNRSVSCTGIGLHSGNKIKLALHPAPENSGIVFYRTDAPGSPGIKACLENVVHTQLATSLGSHGLVVGTVEHLMSAFSGLGVDNVRVEVSGPEIPIMDGSSAPFIYLLKSVGVRPQSRYKKFCVIRERMTVDDGDKLITVSPSRELSIDYAISFDHPLIRSQRMNFKFSDAAFEKDLSRARTFTFLKEVEYLQKNGLARGGSLANAVVLDHYRILNQDGLRFQDEFLRHKLLDFIGDISLMGAPLIGHFQVVKSGHTLNHNFMTRLKENTSAWEMIEFSKPSECEACNVRVPALGLLDTARPSRVAA